MTDPSPTAPDTFDGAVAHIAHREHPRQARFERQRRALQRPRRPAQIAVGQDEPALVQVDAVAEPFGAGFGTDHDEDRRGREALALSAQRVLQREGLQAGLAVGAGDLRAHLYFHIGGSRRAG